MQSPLTDAVTYFVHPTPSGSFENGAHTRINNGAAFYDYPEPSDPSPYDTPNITVNSSTGFYDWTYRGQEYIPQNASENIRLSEIFTGIKATPLHEYVNGEWGGHTLPTDIVTVADPAQPERVVYMDQVFSVGTADSGFSKSVENALYKREYLKRGYAGDGDSHFYGWATCHWLRHCSETAGEQVGSPCSATLAGVDYDGYCFTSDSGSLECGHTFAIDDKWGENPVTFDGIRAFTDAAAAELNITASPTSTDTMTVVSPNILPSQAGYVVPSIHARLRVRPGTPGEAGTAYRCPTGSPAKTLGSFVSKRLLLAGCMISSDSNYDELADVHVPAYCNVSADYLPGCPLPTASNYDASSKQIGKCLLPTKGCRSSTALNYNSEAVIDDLEYPCIEPVSGCTVSSISYDGVESGTTAYRSGYYASSNSVRGKIPETAYNGPAVVNYNPSANVNSGCIVAIEGCMDPGALNYDSQATIDSNSWCIPRIIGCMNPESPAFNPVATIPNASACVLYRKGCMNKWALNYDPRATVDYVCSFKPGGYNEGCLNPLALNFGCKRNLGQTTPCDASNLTHHALAACNWLPPPPSPPSPPSVAPEAPTGQLVTVEHSVQITLPASGDVTDFTPAILSNITAQFASQLNLDASRISVTVRAASVSIVVTIRADDEAAAAGLQTTVSSAMSDMASAEAFLGDLPITLLAVPTVEKKVTYTFVPDPNASSGGGGGAAVAIIIILVVIAAFGCYYVRRKRKASGKYPWPINKVFPIVAEEEEAMERRRRIEFGSAPPPQQAQAYLASGGSSGAGAVVTSAEAEAAGVVDEGAWRAPANRNPEFNPTLPPIPPRETTPQKAEAEEEPKYVMASEAAATAASSVAPAVEGAPSVEIAMAPAPAPASAEGKAPAPAAAWAAPEEEEMAAAMSTAAKEPPAVDDGILKESSPVAVVDALKQQGPEEAAVEAAEAPAAEAEPAAAPATAPASEEIQEKTEDVVDELLGDMLSQEPPPAVAQEI